MAHKTDVDQERIDKVLADQEARRQAKAAERRASGKGSKGKTGKHTLPKAPDQPFPSPDVVAMAIGSLVPPHLARHKK